MRLGRDYERRQTTAFRSSFYLLMSIDFSCVPVFISKRGPIWGNCVNYLPNWIDFHDDFHFFCVIQVGKIRKTTESPTQTTVGPKDQT